MTLQINAAMATPTPLPPVPTPSADGTDFARQLDRAEARQRDAPPPDTASSRHAERPEHGPAAGNASAQQESAQRKAAAARGAPERKRSQDSAEQATADSASPATPHAADGSESTARPEHDARAAARDDDESAAAALPALDLSGLIARRALPDAAAEAAGSAKATRGTGAARKALAVGDAAQAPPGAAPVASTAASAAAAMEAAAVLPRAAGAEPGARHVDVDIPGAVPGVHAGVELNRSVGATLPATAAQTLHAELPAAPGSALFPAALGVQLSTWIRDGVQQAQLHLNPADLGPIGVRISLDGTQAQINFHAAHATTREALEAAVPSLASALHESGFTLSGGGVSQQPQNPHAADQPEARADGAGRTRGGDEAGIAAPALTRATAARGIVDVYA